MLNVIAKIAEEKNLSEHQAELLEFIYKNRHKEIFIATVASVSKSGMSRNIKLGIVKNNTFLNVTHLIAKLTGEKLSRDKEALLIKGCGMDMIFSIIYSVYCKLECISDANTRYNYF